MLIPRIDIFTTLKGGYQVDNHM